MTYVTSTAGLALIQEFEGFRAEPAQMPDGNWVVGYSHVRVGEAGPALTQSDAESLLASDLAPVERVVNVLVTETLTQTQFDALVSFAFSLGVDAFAQSQVLRRVNSGDFVAAACAMDAWRKVEINGELEVSDALVRRRAAEKALFLKQSAVEAAPSVMLRAKLDHAASILGAPVKPAAKVANEPLYQPVAVAVGNVVAFAAPAAESIAPTPVFEPAVRLTEILKSEPQTEALLLTQVIANDDADDQDELVTAHAKPVARPLDDVREATRRAYNAQEANAKPRFAWFKRKTEAPVVAVATEIRADHRLRDMRRNAEMKEAAGAVMKHSFEHVGLAALLVFGLVLIALGGSLLFAGTGEVIEIVAAAAVGTPGVAAVLMAAYGFRRTPRTSATA